MNDQLQKALSELANKLGTTVQYLWRVLISQAKIEFIEDLTLWIFTVLFGIVLSVLHIRFNKKKKDGQWESNYYDKNEASGPIMICVTVIWLIFFISCWGYTGDMINAHYNPQFWALKQIIK